MRALAGWVAGIALLAGTTAACAGQDPGGALPARVAHLLDRGRAEEALALLAPHRHDPAWAGPLAEALGQRGRLAEAEAALRAAAAPGRWLERARLAELLVRAGRPDEGLRLAAETDGAMDPAALATAADWLAFGIVSRLAGSREPARFRDALDAFDRAIAGDSAWLEPRLRVGDLFLEKYNAPDAREAFEDVLRRDPGNGRALLGLARVALFAGDPRAWEAAQRALEAGPGHAAAHALLGRLFLDAERPDSAAAAADRALALDSTAVEAWGLRGAVQAVAGDWTAYQDTERRLRAGQAAPAAFFVAVAEALGRQRRYEEAVLFGRRAVEFAPDDPAALTTLGVNELRTGAMDSGRVRLERAFARDPFHVWNKNTLDLLDLVATWPVVRHGRFEFVAPAAEAGLLVPYLGPLLERAWDTLAARYGYEPGAPVRLELYGRHADFSVRTVGLAGLGALGVSFGRVLAMDAPSARPPGEMNWGSTAWHELAHTFTLGASGHRVPRWLSEGLSVLEERRARAGWGAGPTLAFLSAYKGGGLRPPSRLNDGFVRPRHPAEIGWSYYLASLVCEYLEEAHGPEAVRGLLAAYREGRPTDAAIRQALGQEPEALDRRFDAWFRARFREALARTGAARDTVANPGELGSLLERGRRLLAAGRDLEAQAVLERVQEAFPDQADPESAAWLLSRIHLRQGDTARAVAQLARVTGRSDTHLAANLEEAALREAAGDRRGAMAALERAIFIHPYDAALHERLAALATAEGEFALAVRERRAVVALDPADPAEARYRLALAYRDAGDPAAARREVLRALEGAPGFEPAQRLLLDLRGRP